jgi:hypothetical protein
MAGVQYAGEFDISEAWIITSSGLEVDISTSIITLTLFEDIFQAAISGQILMFDAVALASIGPLIGQEYLSLKLKTPTLNDPDTTIDFTKEVFHIHSMNSKEDMGKGIQGYTLNFTSGEIVRNQRTKISKVLKGSYSDIVKEMLGALDCKKDLYIEPTSGNVQMVANHQSPFGVIKQCQSMATASENGSPTYLFFETAMGYHFRSLDSLYAQGAIHNYKPTTAGKENIDNGKHDIEKELKTALSHNVVGQTDTLAASYIGATSSKLIVHDIFNKSYSSHTYNLHDNFVNESHINSYAGSDGDFPIYSSAPVDEDENRISDFPTRQYVLPTSIKDRETQSNANYFSSNRRYPYQSSKPQEWLQRRHSQMFQLDSGLQVMMTAYGNTVVKAGDIVSFSMDLGSPSKVEGVYDQKDKLYQGPFLVKRIRHDFDFAGKKHEMGLFLVKDSVGEELENGGNAAAEPRSKTKGIVHDSFYDYALDDMYE